MIGPGTGVRVYLACGVTEMRKGIAGLAALAETPVTAASGKWSGVCVSRSARRSDQTALPGWSGLLPLLQGA